MVLRNHTAFSFLKTASVVVQIFIDHLSRSNGASLEPLRSQRNILFLFAVNPGGIGSAFHRVEKGGK
jgi:hypothetical protein